LDGDGRITVDELYDYAYEKVKLATPKQSPSKFSSKQQGEIVLRQSMKSEDIKSVPLPVPILDSIENPFADIRLGAVQQLTRLLNGKNRGLARSAREALESIAENDDSRQVASAATQALETARQGGQRTIQLQTEALPSPASQKEQLSKLETDESSILSGRQTLITLGWAIAGAIGGVIYNAPDEAIGPVLGGAIGGAIGGLITAIALKDVNPRSNRTSMWWVPLAWAIGGGVGWTIGEALTEAIGMAIGFLVGVSISMAILLGARYIVLNWKSIAWIVLGWGIGSGIGWYIARRLLIDSLSVDYATSW